jgi:hypothetical protein
VNGDDRRPGQALIIILWYVRRCGSVVCVSQRFGPAFSLSLSLSLSFPLFPSSPLPSVADRDTEGGQCRRYNGTSRPVTERDMAEAVGGCIHH